MDNEQVREFLYQLENNIERAESDSWTVLSLDVQQGANLREMLRRLLADSDALAKLRAEIAGAPVCRISMVADGDATALYLHGEGGKEALFDMTGQRVALLRLPAGEGA